jgi:hypothetical protein
VLLLLRSCWMPAMRKHHRVHVELNRVFGAATRSPTRAVYVGVRATTSMHRIPCRNNRSTAGTVHEHISTTRMVLIHPAYVHTTSTDAYMCKHSMHCEMSSTRTNHSVYAHYAVGADVRGGHIYTLHHPPVGCILCIPLVVYSM